ncbi:sensor histidine kinase [Henriciella aquimarina]|uniref:sensor histidine kinase n=1 Tax=Henriciella aquimarina TaxID=545261 RepID=UPI00117A23DA|nr:HAMP domain-containing sensor histidine kinase [Henriciella aquimarina]
MSGTLLLWLILIMVASVFVMLGGVTVSVALLGAGLCALPLVTTLIVAGYGREWPRGRRAALACLPWILMSTLFIALSGGLASPALAFAIFPPVFAMAFGWKRLAVEAAVFSLIAVIGAVCLPLVLPEMQGFDLLAPVSGMYAFAALCALPFIVYGLVSSRLSEPASGMAEPAREPTRRASGQQGWPVTPLQDPAAGLDPIEPAPSDEAETGNTIIDVTREGRIRSSSGPVPAGLSFRPGRVFLDAFPEDIRGEVAAQLDSGAPFRLPLGEGRTVELTVDRHDLGMRIFLSEVDVSVENETIRPEETDKRVEALETELAERTAFFAGLGHELKTPLNAILGFTEIMRAELRGPMPEGYKDYSNLIHESGQDLLLMIEDILDYAKAEAGHSRLELEPVDLVASGESVLAQLSGQAQRLGVTVALKAEGEVWARADARAIRQIWQNLLSNAIKYSEPGGTVTLLAREGRNAVALSVKDEGAGMDAEDLERVARPFQQGRNAKGRAGTGLGLAVVRSFAEAMKGKVVIDTAPGEGTRVRVILPKANKQDLGDVEDAAQ